MTQGKPPDSSQPTQGGEPNPDELQRTRYGNPHAAEHESVRISQAVRVAPNAPVYTPPPASAPPAAAFNKTMLGMPADLQALLRGASSPQPPEARPPQPSAAGRSVAAQPVRSIGGPSDVEAQPTRQARTEPPPLPRHGATAVMSAAAPAPPPNASHTSGIHPSRTVALPQSAAAQSAPRLSLSMDQPAELTSVTKPVRRWPALVLLGLGFVAFGAVLALRAPHLLPGPMGRLMTRVLHRVPDAAAAEQPAPTQVTDVSAAQDPAQKPEDTPQTARARPAPVAVQGGLADLEKQALDRLVANDLPGAKQFYDRLHMAAPSHSEYALMVELLTRVLEEPACGQPGQEPCR
jgi:hypothetical protein